MADQIMTADKQRLAATGSYFMRGYHFQGTCRTFAPAATASHMLGLDAEQARHTLGIAG